ncbi:armadillo-like helical domain-containing protein 3 isoform X5 [Canis lupus baileyi]|uniref:armadillo-like helical domain-containing protein 3 isoform X5 n=1 Tax=Canis lupus dingo TaxID=286419 RepID=UPI0020C4D6E1|nr:armadillo-like helical domain-containing protein 3 isoform X5 [Canis lupus dingo]
MAQVEKRGGLLRKSSASKKPLKEKVVLMYDEIFMTEDPSKCSPRFWEELFLMKVNLEYLEGKLESLDGEELMKIKDNINCLFQHCIQALGEEHPIRVVNALQNSFSSLQTLCALIRGVHQKNKSTSGFDIINMLMGFDKAELCMKNLMESLDSLLCAEGSESLKSLCLKLLLCLVTVTDNISQNTILEYVMINSIFEAILQILSHPPSRREHGYDAVVLLALLVNYRKYELRVRLEKLKKSSNAISDRIIIKSQCSDQIVVWSVNPYIVKLSIVDDEATLNGMGLVIAQALSEYNRQYKDKEEEHQSGFFSALTNMVGSMFIADAHEKISVQTNEAILLALYEAVHLNRNFITVLAQSHPEMGLVTTPVSPAPTTPATPLGTTPPSSDVISSVELPLDADVQTSNLLITFLKYSSIVMQDTKDEHRLHSGKLCLIILTCIAEDQYANAFLHDDNMNFRVNLHRMPMRHRKKAADKNLPCRPLVCAVLDLMVEFIVTHMMKEFPMDLYVRCIQVVHKLLCYQKKCRVRLHYTWRELWSVLRLSTNAGQWKEAASKVTHALVNIRAIINHFNPKIESYAAVNHISQLSEEQVLEVVRANYDTLTLKLQDGLDQYERYSEQHKEAAFFKELVRSISTNVRRNLAFHTLSQEVLLKEFSTIS